MILSGYQLGINLIQSSPEKLNLDRELLVKSSTLTVQEYDLINPQKSSTRNSLFRLVLENTGFIVKQPKVLTSQTRKSFRKEVLIYELLRDTDFSKFIPSLIDKDEILHLMYLEDIKVQNVVRELKLAETEPYKSEFEGLLVRLSEVFNLLHLYKECPPDLRPEFGFEKPSLLYLTEYSLHNFVQNNSTESISEVIDILMDEKVFNCLKNIKWEIRCLINYEFKFDHVHDLGETIKLVDWEFADFGDPDYDLASVLFEIYRVVSPYHSDKLRITEYFNHFISYYEHDYDPVKINQYFAIQVLFQSINNEAKTIPPLTLKLASEILKGKEYFDIKKKTWEKKGDTKPLNFKRIVREGKYSAYNHRIFLTLVEEMRALNRGGGKEIIPEESVLKEEIYKWYYRADNIQSRSDDTLYRNSKIKIADIPEVSKRKINESLWWKVQERTDKGQVVARKNSEKRVEGPGQFYILSDTRTNFYVPRKSFNDTAYVSLVFPRFAVTRNSAVESKMDLWVNGKNKVRQDYTNWVRFYFHLHANPDGIYFFIEEVRNLFDDRCIPFELKLRNDLNRYYRADCAILFIHRQHFIAALHPIRTIYDKLREFKYLRDEVPRFTKKLSLGLGFAENPFKDDDSFGNLRAGIIARSMVRNWDKENDDVVSGILKEFAEEGYNTYELYRNPIFGKNEFKYRFDLFYKIKHYFKINRVTDHLQLNRKSDFQEVARQIAFTICREAIWYGDYCNWLSFKINSYNQPEYQLLSHDEKAGVGLFLAGMSVLCPNDFVFLQVSKGCYDKESLTQGTLDPLSVYRLFYGMIKDQNIIFRTSNVVGSFYLDMFTKPEKSWELIAQNIIVKYFDKGIPFPSAYCNDWNDENGTELCFTLTHGLAALGYFFMDLAAQGRSDIIIPFKGLISGK